MATLQAPAPAYYGLSSFAFSTRDGGSKASNCNSRVRPTSRAIRSGTSIPTLPTRSSPSASFGFLSSSITETSLRAKHMDILNIGKGRGSAFGTVCSLPASPETLRWIFLAAASVLLFIKNTVVPKQFLVPLLALELPYEPLRWIKGDFGLWTAFLALAVKLFYQLPGELELPLYVLLLIITAPAQLTQYRGTTPSAVAALAIAGYLNYEHFKSVGSVKAGFQNDKIFPTIALLALLVVPILLLVNGVYY